MAFSLDSKIKEILKDPRAREVLDKYAEGASSNPQMKLVGGLQDSGVSWWCELLLAPKSVVSQFLFSLHSLRAACEKH